MKTVKYVILILFICSASLANASLRSDMDEKNVQITKKELMSTKFESILERDLTDEEFTSLSKFINKSGAVDNINQYASMEAGSDVTTIMFCLGAKGALAMKIGGSVCLDTSGEAYILVFIGVGFSYGAAASATVLVHKGNTNTIKGTYQGLTGGYSGQIVMDSGLKGVLKSVGGEVAVMGNKSNNSMIALGGLSFGPMIDISGFELRVR